VVLSHDTSSCSCMFVALPPLSDASLRVGVCRRPWCARLCVYSTSRLLNVVVLLFCMCLTRGIHSFFAVAVLLLRAERLLARAWRRCVSRCDVRDRRSVAALSSGMTASGTCGLSGCIVLGSLAHGVVRER
jgi:hypothetical protein